MRIAPFRAFVEERKATGATGKNWLFFGDRSQKTDYLYGEEWQTYLKDGILNELDLAWSRDQEQKVYVQHKMLEKDPIVGLVKPRCDFLCLRDASRMAKDVDQAPTHDSLRAGLDERGRGYCLGKEFAKGKRHT